VLKDEEIIKASDSEIKAMIKALSDFPKRQPDRYNSHQQSTCHICKYKYYLNKGCHTCRNKINLGKQQLRFRKLDNLLK